MIVKASISRLLLSVIFCDYAIGLIIPEDLPTVLSLIYSNIPPIKKGTDSRFGVGFRLGEHADFQVVIELGPQTETSPIGTNDAKRRRDAMFNAAMRGDLGPFAQAVAKYQMDRRIQQEIDKFKVIENKLKKIQTENKSKDTVSNDWLTEWRQEISQSLEKNVPLPAQNNNKIIQLRVAKSDKSLDQKNKLEEVTKLHNSQVINTTETQPVNMTSI